MDSTGALELEDIPERLLVIGGGIIGLEMATVYDALGSKVTVVELLDQLIPGCDKDLVRLLEKRIEGRYEAIHLDDGVESRRGQRRRPERSRSASTTETFDRILVAVGRRPNGKAHRRRRGGRRRRRARLHRRRRAAAHERAAHLRDRRRRGEPMLAHKATHEGALAAEVDRRRRRRLRRPLDPVGRLHRPRGRLGRPHRDPGQGRRHRLRERRASRGRPPAARWRSAAATGLTKLLVDPETNRILGAGIVGVNAGELIAEAVLAIEMGATPRTSR